MYYSQLVGWTKAWNVAAYLLLYISLPIQVLHKSIVISCLTTSDVSMTGVHHQDDNGIMFSKPVELVSTNKLLYRSVYSFLVLFSKCSHPMHPLNPTRMPNCPRDSVGTSKLCSGNSFKWRWWEVYTAHVSYSFKSLQQVCPVCTTHKEFSKLNPMHHQNQKHWGIYLIRPAGKMWYETNPRVEVARYKMDAPMTVDH